MHQCFAEEILLQRTFILVTRVILKRSIPVCTESSGEHGDVPEHRFSTVQGNEWHEIRKDCDIQRFVEDVGHLVLEVLSSHCDDKDRVKKGEIYTKGTGGEPRGFRSLL